MELVAGIGFLISRYVHVVCTTLIVGGTLFFEMVVPVAIADCKPEQQLAIVARARWVFRQIVWSSALVLIASGVITSRQHWPDYSHEQLHVVEFGANGKITATSTLSAIQRPGWWWVAHLSTGVVAVLIALSLTIGSSPPQHPVGWMRLNLIVLMIVIFLGSAARHVRLNQSEKTESGARLEYVPAPPSGDSEH